MFAASKSGSVSEPTDSKFNYVTMLLHGNGTNGAQNNTFIDSSTNNFTITRNGNTTQGTFTPYGSNWSNYFDGVGDRLSSPANTAIDLSTADFTIECWVYPTSFSSTKAIIVYQNGDASNTNYGYWLIIKTTGVVRFENFSGSSQVGFDASTAISLNTWNHIAVTRTGTSATTYINGVGTTGTVSATFNAPTGAILNIGDNYGASFGSSNPYSGYISNLRIVKGTRVYTANFTPPTSPLTAITNTSLLTCKSNRFIDNSTNNFTITVNGDTSVQRFSPFSPTTAYSTSVIGGSGYFDGSGDYLSTPSTGQFAPTGDFTISCWYYPTSTRAYQQIIGNFNGSASTVWIFEITSGTGISFYTNGITPRISGSGLVVNAWNYLVLARSGSTITGYVNGVSLGTYTQSGTFGSATQSISIGRAGSSTAAGDFGLGYIADVKLIDGSAVTTVPTAPQTATSGTNLLLSYTNAGILDNAMMNDLETVGNAQISTSVKKYGTGSMYFDGTGDYLTSPLSSTLAFGSGDFTVECWVYATNTSALRNIIGNYNGTLSTASFVFQMESTGRITGGIYSGSSFVGPTSTASISATTWTHLAVVRNGTSIKLYINGTNDGSTTSSSVANTPSGIFSVGAEQGSYGWNGYIDDLRITKGYARYTSNFTPPTAAFADKG